MLIFVKELIILIVCSGGNKGKLHDKTSQSPSDNSKNNRQKSTHHNSDVLADCSEGKDQIAEH